MVSRINRRKILIRILDDQEALLCHHSKVWVRLSNISEVIAISAIEPPVGCDSLYINVRLDDLFEKEFLLCACSGLNVDAFLKKGTLKIMEARRLEMVTKELGKMLSGELIE